MPDFRDTGAYLTQGARRFLPDVHYWPIRIKLTAQQRTGKLDAAPKLAEALAALCYARSVRGELFKLPHVENIFCGLYAARVNSFRP